MWLTLERLAYLDAGGIDCIEVGQIPYSVRQALGWRSTIVYLSRDSLAHIRQRHPDLSDLDLLLISPAIETGLLIREAGKPYLLACYQHPEDEKQRFKANIKAALGETDLWLHSFHRTHPRQTRALLKRGHKLRDHK